MIYIISNVSFLLYRNVEYALKDILSVNSHFHSKKESTESSKLNTFFKQKFNNKTLFPSL